jgi:hypothetical protein
MAVIGDLASVLRDIRTKTDNIIIDPIWREVNGLDNEQAASAAKDRRINKRKSLLLMNALDDAKKNERKANPTDQAPVDKCKMVVFETPKDLKSFAFDKEKPIIPPMAAPKKSGLSKMIGNVALTDMKVFVPHMTKPIVIKIAQTATFEKLMEMVIRKVNSMDPNNQLNEDTDAYVLRMADEKGNVDDDFPEISARSQVGKFNEALVLRENAKYKADAASDNRLFLKIHMPNNTYITMAFDLETKMSKVLEMCCRKRDLSEHEHVLQYMVDSTYLPRDLRVADLKDLDINLINKQDVKAEEQGGEIFWYEALATQYKTYNVVYLKKFGKKQDRVIGVDGIRITHTVVKKKGPNKQLQPNSIKDVKSVRMDEKSLTVTIEFKSKDTKPLTFDVSSGPIAREIVGKINYLISMNQDKS